MSSRHQEGLAHLLYGINQGNGFVALTGEVGTGKTTLCQCLLQQLPDEVDLALVLNPKLTAVELLATICDELSVAYNKYRQTLKHLVDTLNHYLLSAHAKGRRTVLMIDEAQNLSFPVLEQVRLLTNLETSKQKLLQIILVGQPELRELLASPKLRQLNQRITARYHLPPLNRTETGLYIKHRLAVAHGDQEIFKTSAIRTIYRFSSGIPRLINLICDRSLLGCYVHNSRRVTTAIVYQAAREVDSLLLVKQQKRRKALLAAGLLLSILAAGYYHWPATTTYFSEGGRRTSVSHLIKTPEIPASIEATEVTTSPVDTAVSEDPKQLEPKTEVVEVETSERIPEDFPKFLERPELTLSDAFIELLRIWRLPSSTPYQCDQLPINCLAGQSTWRELIGLNRPAILEFSISAEQKRHLLLVGVDRGRPLFRHRGNDIDFSLYDVLTTWQGDYMLFWKSPQNGVSAVYPGQRAPTVSWLRDRLDTLLGAVPVTGSRNYFDAGLRQQVVRFQLTSQLQADGIAGPRTIIHLQNQSPAGYGPRLRISD